MLDLTHGCPIGLADSTLKRATGAKRCFLEANKTIGPRVHPTRVRVTSDGQTEGDVSDGNCPERRFRGHGSDSRPDRALGGTLWTVHQPCFRKSIVSFEQRDG